MNGINFWDKIAVFLHLLDLKNVRCPQLEKCISVMLCQEQSHVRLEAF